MKCKSRNGETFINTLVPVPGGTATDTDYVIDMTHYLCGNRQVCANSSFPISCNLNYRVLSVEAVGDAFVANIFISGQVSYKPYRSGNGYCGCEDNCYKTDNIWATCAVPVTTAATPTVTGGAVNAQAANLRDCCSVSDAVSLVTSFNVTSA